MIIETERLILRSVVESDLADIHSLHCLEEVDRFNTLGIPENIDGTKRLVDEWIFESQKEIISEFTFAIEIKSKTHFIGLIGISLGKPKYRNAEVWFKFDPEFWNNGFATEALNHILNFGFTNLHLHRIEAGCAVENFGSIKVLEKCGMIREGHTRQILPLKSGWSDNYGYAKLSTD